MKLSAQECQKIRTISYECLLDLATEEGINASGKNEIFGCIFGRDSAITVLKILNALSSRKLSRAESDNLKNISRKALLTLVNLQGKKINIESGEQPGKFIHEYRKEKYEHLIKKDKPWFLDSDKKLRNYDSIDSTPLILIAIYKYFDLTQDRNFIVKVLPAVEKGLNWIISYGDLDKDFLLEYEFHKERKYGGLLVQSWTDSHECLIKENGEMPSYPIAPVEVQGYAWLALKLWAEFYAKNKVDHSVSQEFANLLLRHADKLKEIFNRQFLFEDNCKLGKLYFPSQALDGQKNRITTITGNPILLLWATYSSNDKKECILKEEYITNLVKRVFLEDMFDEDGGIRTMSALSKAFNPRQDSYHNGSFWPKLNGMGHEGLLNWGYKDEADRLRHASLKPLHFFQTPVELYMKDENGQFVEYKSTSGQVGCRTQAWSAAAALDLTGYCWD